jgi:hypothetical protein
MTRLGASTPEFENESERVVWERLDSSLGAGSVLLPNLRLTSRK